MEGAHRLTNTGSVPLVYLDVDYVPDTDVCVYPDSKKVGVYHRGFCGIYRLADDKDYYEGE